MSVLTQEYTNLKNRQDAIKQDMLGVAEAIKKLDNNLGKQIIANIGSQAANYLGIPIKIPTQFAYASLGVLGIIPAIRESNKMKKYIARIKELETEYNENALKLQQLDVQVLYDTPNNNNLPDKPPKNNTSPLIWVLLALVLIGVLFWTIKY